MQGWSFCVKACCGGNLTQALPRRTEVCPKRLFAAAQGDWNRDCMPWPAPELPRHTSFSGGVRTFWRSWKTACLQRSAASIPSVPMRCTPASWDIPWEDCLPCGRCATAGCLTGRFRLPDSLWYHGWLDFLRRHLSEKTCCAYLSLGDRKERGGPTAMRMVRMCTEQTAAFLAQRLGENAVAMQWNGGGHFIDIQGR